MLESLADAPATASMLARELGESSGATSYHLRALAAAGLIIEDLDRALSAEPGIVAAIKRAGYQHATIDLKPFKSGRLNVEPARPATSR